MPDLSASKLKRTRDLVNEDPNFRHLGNIDLNMGIKVDQLMYLVSFEGFTCHDIREIGTKDVREADFIIEMSSQQWSRFVSGCQSGNGPSLVQLDTSDNIVKAADPRTKLTFLRYHTSIQAFFETYATLDATVA